jgi:hypothetical protein
MMIAASSDKMTAAASKKGIARGSRSAACTDDGTGLAVGRGENLLPGSSLGPYDEDFDAFLKDPDPNTGLVSIPTLRSVNIVIPDGLSKLFKPLFQVMETAGFPRLTGLFSCFEECLLKLRMILTEASIPHLTDGARIRIPALKEGYCGIFDFRLRGGKPGPFHPYNKGDDSFFFFICEEPRPADLTRRISGL